MKIVCINNVSNTITLFKCAMCFGCDSQTKASREFLYCK